MTRMCILLIVFGAVLTSGTLGIPTTCDDGWTAYEGFCYWFGTIAQHFTEAEHYCRQRDSHLIEVYSTIENAFIKDRLRKLKPHCYWIGMKDELIEGVWSWHTTQNNVNVTDWYPGQPGHDGDEDCAVFWTNFDYRWGDYPCMASCVPICKHSGDDNELSIVG